MLALVKSGVPLNLLPISLTSSSSYPKQWSWKCGVAFVQGRSEQTFIPSISKPTKRFPSGSRAFRVGAFLFDPTRDPIIKDALKEPVAFMGGMVAGLLRLDLNEDPLREWIGRTAEAAGITEEEIETGNIQLEESPQQIEIE